MNDLLVPAYILLSIAGGFTAGWISYRKEMQRLRKQIASQRRSLENLAPAFDQALKTIIDKEPRNE